MAGRAKPKSAKSEQPRDLGLRARELRARGFSYALIERELGIPYLHARELAAEYDAKHGKPKKIIRTAATNAVDTGAIAIPVRDLRNDTARILRQVEKGQRFLITVSGRTVAELSRVGKRSTFMPRSEIERIIREAPLDPGFTADIESVLGERIDEV